MLTKRWNRKVVATTALLFLFAWPASGKQPDVIPQPDEGKRVAGGAIREHRKTEIEALDEVLRNLAAVLEEVRPVLGKAGRPEAHYEYAIQEAMERLRQLRLQQVDLEAAMERAAIDNQELRVRDLRRALVEVQHELQRGQLELERVMMDRESEVEQRDLRRMADRLEYVASWGEVAFDSMQAVVMATQAIVEIHLAADDVAGAIEQLEGLLPRIEKCGSRTAIRFALKDLYMEKGEPQRAADHMLQVVVENSR